jgi:hypothetical protein
MNRISVIGTSGSGKTTFANGSRDWRPPEIEVWKTKLTYKDPIP